MSDVTATGTQAGTIEATPVTSPTTAENTVISQEAAAGEAAPAVETGASVETAPTPVVEPAAEPLPSSPLADFSQNNSVAEEPVVSATNEAPVETATATESGFATLGLSAELLQAVHEAGYTTPTPIQAEGIPHVIARRDLIGIAQTGTGKTASFTLPMIELLARGRAKARMPRSLILEPTRELAAQVAENFAKYGKYNKLSMALLIGGVSFDDQDKKLDRGVDVLIATPGRLMDHFERGKLMLSQVQILVIDEADRMLDMGFVPDVEKICKLLPFTRQTLFYSATMPPEIRRLTEQFLSNPVRVEVTRAATTATNIKQELVEVPNDDWAKREALRTLIREAGEITNAIVFCNKKHTVDIVAKSLSKHGFNAAPLHGDLDQSVRTRTLDGFRSGDVTILVASDVAARGLDIPAVSHVFNFDVPYHSDDYVHRIGRTGRAGRSGEAYMLVTRTDGKYVEAIEKLTKTTIARRVLEGLAEQVRERPARDSKSRDNKWGDGDRRDRGGRRGERRGDRKDRDRHEHPIKPHGQVASMEPIKPVEAPVKPARPDHRNDHRSEHRSDHRAERKFDRPNERPVERPAEPIVENRPAPAQYANSARAILRPHSRNLSRQQQQPPRVESRPVDISQLPAFLLRPVKLPPLVDHSETIEDETVEPQKIEKTAKPQRPKAEPAQPVAEIAAEPKADITETAPVTATIEAPVAAAPVEAPAAVEAPEAAPVIEAPEVAAPIAATDAPAVETAVVGEMAEKPTKPKRTRVRAAKPASDKPATEKTASAKPRRPRKKKEAPAGEPAPAETAISAEAPTEPAGEPGTE